MIWWWLACSEERPGKDTPVDTAEPTPCGAEADAPEVCNGVDDDCDGRIDDDDDDVTDPVPWYTDGDGDGYGVEPLGLACAVADAAPRGGDCDDGDASVYPGALDVCGDDRVTDCSAARTSDAGLVTVGGRATFDDLQQALDAAYPGDGVVVCEGTWVGPLEASVPVGIVGHGGREGVVLSGGDPVLTLPGGSGVEGVTLTGGQGEFGGALAVISSGTLSLVDVSIEGNRAVSGGGLWIGEDVDAVVSDSVIRDNVARGGGGGVWAGSGATVDLTGTTIEGNRAVTGGGLRLEGASAVGGVVIGNWTEPDQAEPWLGGGGGVATSGDVSLTDTVISANWVVGGFYVPRGGGLWIDPGAITLTDVVVSGNLIPDGQGGGLYGEGFEATFAGTTVFTENSAYSGGGLFCTDCTLTGGTVSDNVAGDVGGGIVTQGAAVISDLVLANNRGPVGGGAFCGGSGAVERVTASGNQAQFGGALELVAGYDWGDPRPTWTVVDSAIVDNVAEEAGGILFATEDVPGLVLRTTLEDNVATDIGGALSIWNGPVVIEDSVLSGNVADRGGAVGLKLGGELQSVTSDWAIAPYDNVPDDVWTGSRSVTGYGDGATFSCVTTCDPLP